MTPALLLSLLSLALAGAGLGVAITAHTRANVVRGGYYLVSTHDGRVTESAIPALSLAVFNARRSTRTTTFNIETTGKYEVNMTTTVIRAGPFRLLALTQTSNATASVGAAPPPYTIDLDLVANDILEPSDLPHGNGRYVVLTGVTYGASTQRDLVGRLDGSTGNVTITAAGPATAVGPFPSVGVFVASQISQTVCLETTTFTWHTLA